MEIDWIRPCSLDVIQSLLREYPFDLFVGSLHHVHTIPIDYNKKMYFEAREKSGGTDEKLAEAYYDLQYEMLKALKPPVVGHFDLIRLLSDDPEASSVQWAGVWQKILRNLDFIVDYGGLVELNSAGLRKGMSEPYPKAEICKVGYQSSKCNGIWKTEHHQRNSSPEEVPLRCPTTAMASNKSVRTIADV